MTPMQDKLIELIERVMTEHWDMAACPCAFCEEARKLGCGPRYRYPTNPPVSILDDGSNERMLPVYDWTEKACQL